MRELLIRVKSLLRQKGGRVVYVALIVVGFMLITASARDIYSMSSEDASARSEYDLLRDMFYTSPGFSGFMTDQPGTGPLDAGGADPRNAILRQADSNRPNQAQPGALAELMGINRDFVGWVSIEGTGVSYPVVRGGDNSYYLNTTFTGSRNPAGSIFMDYRLERGFNAPVCILYGHNMRDGSMFAQLNQYLDSAFMEEHQDIRIITPEGHYLVYRVFDARSTDMWDTAYDVDLMEDSYAAASNGASGGAGRFLLLSTCTPGADRSGRMLVYAALVQH